VQLASYLKAPVLGLYGGMDDGIPVSTVEEMEGAIATAQGASQIIVYPDAPHGFHADYRPSYREETAMEAWGKLQSWFQDYGIA